MKKTIKKTSSESKAPSSMRDKLIRRKKEFEKRAAGGIIFPKEGTFRFRLKDPGDDIELAIEVTQFYLGPEIGGVISPATFDEPCPFMEKYRELKESKDEDDMELAKMLAPKKKYVTAIVGYKDEKGKEVDPDRVDKLMMIPKNAYQDIIDLYLDEEEWGDMTSKKNGYDLKITRAGKGKFDTTYSITPCQKKAMDSKYLKPVDIEKMLRTQISSYEELEEKLSTFLHEEKPSSDEEERPKKKKKKVEKSSTKKKSKYRGDI